MDVLKFGVFFFLGGCSFYFSVDDDYLTFSASNTAATAVDGFVGPYISQIWGDDQCSNLGTIGSSIDEKQCMEQCKDTTDCTAVSFSLQECVMRKCALPVAAPAWNMEGYSGYHLATRE